MSRKDRAGKPMEAVVEPAKRPLPRRRWLAFLDCAAVDDESAGQNVPRAINEDIESEVIQLNAANERVFVIHGSV